jgi:two-component system chemotaxis response regulator CheB
MLDDGTAGMIAIKRCGGVTVVQDPKDAAYPAMPQNVLNNAEVDHCVPIAEMALLLETLATERAGKKVEIPKDIRTEAEIAERVLSDVGQVNELGEQVPYNCPNCGGVLWQMDASGVLRFRCHTGHSFTASALVTSQTEKIEETLWICLRMLEERKNLLTSMAQKERRSGEKRSYKDRAGETQIHIERIRAMLTSPQPSPTSADQVKQSG